MKRWCLGQSGTAAEQGTPQRREYDGRESLEFRMDMEVGDSGVDSSGLSEIAGEGRSQLRVFVYAQFVFPLGQL